MATETVEIYCYDEQVVAQLVDGVLIRVYDDGDVFVTQGYTGDAGTGYVEFGLDGDADGVDYTIRMSKAGVAFDGVGGDEFKSPQSISVFSPPGNSPTGTNNFEVYGNTFSHPVSSDANLCRCSGYLVKPDGTPIDGAIIFITSVSNPVIVAESYASVGNDLQLKTDSSGYVEFDLPRLGVYWITVQGMIQEPRKIYVPDTDGFNLIDILFPVIASITYAPTSVTPAVGGTEDVVPTVVFTDSRVGTGTALDDVEYTVSDGTVASVAVQNDKLVVTGLKAGSTTLSGAPKDESIVHVPAHAITQTPLSITVS